MSESEEPHKVTELADKIAKADKELKEAIIQRDNASRAIGELEDSLHSYRKQMIGLMNAFGHIEKPPQEIEPKTMVDRKKLSTELGDVIYKGTGGSIRQNTYNYVLTLPYVDSMTMIRHFESYGYGNQTAKMNWYVIKNFLLREKGWKENEKGQIVNPNPKKLDLTTATSSEQKAFLDKIHHE